MFRIKLNQATKPSALHPGENAKHVSASLISELAHEHNDLIGWEIWQVCGSELAVLQKERVKRKETIKQNRQARKKVVSILLCCVHVTGKFLTGVLPHLELL